jgi:hypothetical protein
MPGLLDAAELSSGLAGALPGGRLPPGTVGAAEPGTGVATGVAVGVTSGVGAGVGGGVGTGFGVGLGVGSGGGVEGTVTVTDGGLTATSAVVF